MNNNVEQLEIPQEEVKPVQQFNNQSEQVPKKNKGNMPIIILLVIIILGLVGYIVYDKVIAKEETRTVENEDGNNKQEVIDDSKVKTNDNDNSDKITTTTSLLDKELTLEEICQNKNGICDKEVGKFTLAGQEHTLKIYINMDDQNNENLYEKLGESELAVKNSLEANAVIIDSKRIAIGFNYKLDKIVKIDDKYFAIGVDETINTGYEIRIYNSNLNLTKTYSSIHVPKEVARDEKMANNYLDYFKIENNSFTRYSCNTSKDTGDGTRQMLEKYKVTISNEIFDEIKVSEVNEYCSAQD